MKYYLTYFKVVLMFSDRAIIRYVSPIVKYVIVGLFVLEYYICIRYECEYRIEGWFDTLKNYFSLHFFFFYVSCLELGDPDRFFYLSREDSRFCRWWVIKSFLTWIAFFLTFNPMFGLMFKLSMFSLMFTLMLKLFFFCIVTGIIGWRTQRFPVWIRWTSYNPVKLPEKVLGTVVAAACGNVGYGIFSV